MKVLFYKENLFYTPPNPPRCKARGGSPFNPLFARGGSPFYVGNCAGGSVTYVPGCTRDSFSPTVLHGEENSIIPGI